MPIGSFNLNGLAKVLSSVFNYTPFKLIRSTENPTYTGTNQSGQWGRSVALNSTYYAVGANLDRTSTVGGRVDIFSLSDGSLFRTINNPNSQTTDTQDQFGINIVMNETYIAISASYENTATLNDTGVIYVYNISTGTLTWTLTVPSTPAASASTRFGEIGSMAINASSQLVVGQGNLSASSGYAWFYDLPNTGTTFTAFANPNAGGVNTADQFGSGVAINNTYFFVGAPLEDITSPSTTNVGAIYQYRISDLSLITTIYNSDYTTTSDAYGYGGMTANSQYLVIPASNEDTGGTNSGTVYVYDCTSTLSSTPVATIPSPNLYGSAASDQLGGGTSVTVQAVSIITDNYLIIGSPNDRNSTFASKTFYVYKTTDWSLYRFYEHPMTAGIVSSTVNTVIAAANNNYLLLGGYNANGDQSIVNLYDRTSTELTQVDTLRVVDSATNTNSTTITIPSTVIDGDIGILFDASSSTLQTTVPPDWTSLASGTANFSYRISYRRLKSSDASTSISGFATGTRSKILLIIRGRSGNSDTDAVIQGFRFSTPTGQTTTAAPTNQSISMLSTQNSCLGFGVYMATSAITTRGGAGVYSGSGSATEYTAATTHYVNVFAQTNSTYGTVGLRDNITLSMADYGSNALAGFVMELTTTNSLVRPKYPLYANVSTNGELNTSISKFGGSSLRMPAVGVGTTVGPLRNTNQFFNPGTGAYTIEWWAYYTTTPISNNPGWFDMGNDATQRAPLFYYNTTTNIRMLGGGSAGAGTTLLDFPSSSTWPTTSAWHHWAIVRESTSSSALKLYVDGVLKATGTDSGDYTSYPWALNLGGLNPALSATGSQSFGSSSSNIVYIDEFRVSNTARYTAAFTSPTEAFTNDAYTKCLYHFDGTNGEKRFLDDNLTYN